VAVPLDRLPLPKAVLFDLDGTLVDTVELRIEAWERTLGEVGMPTTREELAPLMGLDGKRLAREIAAIAGAPIDEARAEWIDRECGELYERLNHSPRPLPGLKTLIDVLERRSIVWAIATSSRKEQVTTSVTALGLPGEPTIVDASHVKHAKPEPDLLLLAAKQLGVDPAACWYIGDSTWDMVSAVAAGMIAVGVMAGSAVDAATLQGAGAAAVVRTLADLTVAIEARRAS
jgi:HAD superfamily hydrolase (TIGR01509 family)